MPVIVKLMGDLGRLAGSHRVELEGGPLSLAAALEELVSGHKPLQTALFDDSGGLRQATLLVVEGRSLAWPADRDSTIADGGELVLMRYLAGG